MGANIRVSSPTMSNVECRMSNVADSEISVKEAFLLANGGLGRGI